MENNRKKRKSKINKKQKRMIQLAITSMAILVVIIVGIVIGMGKNKAEKESDAASANDKKKVETVQEKTEEEVTSSAVEKIDGQEAEVSDQALEEVVASEVVPTPTPIPTVYPESEGGRKVYLTFDDGTSVQTDKILDILAQYGVKATFFVTAQGGEENAARYRRIVAEGHSIGLHSVSHNYKQIYASLDAYIADVEGIRQFVLDTTGVNSYLYRFPGGSSNSVSNIPVEDCIRYLNQNGYRYYDWNVDTSDSVNRGQSVDEMVSRALGSGVDTYHNCVILMHDSAGQDITVASLPRIIEGLQARGLEILPITENTPLVQHKKASSVQ